MVRRRLENVHIRELLQRGCTYLLDVPRLMGYSPRPAPGFQIDWLKTRPGERPHGPGVQYKRCSNIDLFLSLISTKYNDHYIPPLYFIQRRRT